MLHGSNKRSVVLLVHKLGLNFDGFIWLRKSWFLLKFD
jgi:hypothetical protein